MLAFLTAEWPGVVFQRHSLWYIVSIILTKLKHNYIIVLSVFEMTFLCPLVLWWSKEHGRHRNVFLSFTFMSDNDLNHSFSVFHALQKLLATRGSFWWSTHEYKFLKYADCLHCKAVNWLWTFCRVLNHLNLVIAWSWCEA